MTNFLLVFVGGGVGSLARWGLALALAPYAQTYPNGTLAANLFSCLVVGMIIGLSGNAWWGSETAKLLLITGFCGGFSTFSTLIREVYYLFEGPGWSAALLYAVLSFVLGLVCLAGGIWLGKIVLSR